MALRGKKFPNPRLDVLLPVIMNIVKVSLSTDVFSSLFKNVIVRWFLKKSTLDMTCWTTTAQFPTCITSHYVSHQLHADNTQLYCSTLPAESHSTNSTIEAYITDIKDWIVQKKNKFKVNNYNKEAPLCSRRYQSLVSLPKHIKMSKFKVKDECNFICLMQILIQDRFEQESGINLSMQPLKAEIN